MFTGIPAIRRRLPEYRFIGIDVQADRLPSVAVGYRRFGRGAAIVATVVALTACGKADQTGTAAQAPVDSRPSATTATTNPYGVPTIDPPAPNEAVLTVTGGATPLALTMDQLDALGTTTITIDEPFAKKRQTFTGVPLATLLTKAGIPDSATIDTIALNAYHYSNAARTMIDSGALIATRRDNAAIPYDQGGPIRLVYPDGTPLSAVLDAWNWSLQAITVTGAIPGRP